MAKGDHQRVQNAVDYSTAHSQQPLNETRQRINEQGGDMWNNYQGGVDRNLKTYDSTMKDLQSFRNPTQTNMSAGDTSSFGNLSDPNAWMGLVGDSGKLAQWVQASYPGLSPEGVQYYVQHIQEKPGANAQEQAGSAAYWQGRMPEWLQQHGGANDQFRSGMTNAMGGYQNFAETGGFSPQDLSNIRARSNAPIRGVYSQANAAVDRQRRIQGGYSPNYTASKAKMAREQAYSSADASTNTEAMIAQLLQSGKLAGLGGMAQVGTAGRGQDLASIQGQTSLYGANPGLASTFGQQVTQNRAQDLEGQQLQQAIDELRVKGILGEAGVAGNTSNVLGTASQILSLIGQGAGAASGVPWGKIFGSGAGKLTAGAAGETGW